MMFSYKPILVLTDDVFMHAIEETFSQEKWKIQFSADSLLSLEKARQGVYSLIVADADVSRCNGFIFCRLLKGDSRVTALSLPVFLVISDSNDTPLAKNMLADHVFLKPHLDGLANQIHLALDALS